MDFTQTSGQRSRLLNVRPANYKFSASFDFYIKTLGRHLKTATTIAPASETSILLEFKVLPQLEAIFSPRLDALESALLLPVGYYNPDKRARLPRATLLAAHIRILNAVTDIITEAHLLLAKFGGSLRAGKMSGLMSSTIKASLEEARRWLGGWDLRLWELLVAEREGYGVDGRLFKVPCLLDCEEDVTGAKVHAWASGVGSEFSWVKAGGVDGCGMGRAENGHEGSVSASYGEATTYVTEVLARGKLAASAD